MVTMRDYLATRRSVQPAFLAGPGPGDDTLRAMLTIAARVPDHGKLAPWRFIVFEGDARRAAGEAIAKVAETAGNGADLEFERNRFLRAPTVVAVVSAAKPHPKIPEWEQVLSAGAVCLNLLHAASAFGYAGQWITEWFAYDKDAAAALGVGPDERIAGFIHIGVPEIAPTDRDRPDMDKIVTRFAAE
ncbi:nitroreductase family protein [Acuticoccus kandeliae]|uniref:nitroreductase family protein n=1 Tax=Acuticoccus kandeliae TaxID=2073160 RepID=UPI001475AA95|nr:nitroreductase [Acuticoccus kandeliae]